MSMFEINIDDDAAAAAESYAAERRLPVEGVVVLAIVGTLKESKDGKPTINLKPANLRLREFADKLKETYPSLSEADAKALSDQLQYFAQFATTQEIPDYSGEKE